jgi:hypothetical protein
VPPRKKTTAKPAKLTDEEVAGLRARLSAGEKPRVIVRAASAAVPAGTRGNVIRMGNPSEGEFIVVRLGRDEVPFAPAELALSARGKTATAAARTAPVKKSTAKRGAAPAKKAPAKKAPAKTAAAKKTDAPAKSTARAPAKPAPAKAVPAKPAPAKASRRPAKKAGRTAAQPLTVTLRFTDGSWTVEAQRGARRLAKASTVRPGAVQTFAELVDDDTVREAISSIVASNRTVAEEKAEKLRAELAAAEAALKEYDARRR